VGGSVSDAERFEIDRAPQSSVGWLKHWDWVLVLSIAWLLFELFAQPVLSIATAALKFGLDDFQNGFWLWRKDSSRGRGRTCGVFYIAAGFWQITVMTLLMTVVGMACMAIIEAIDGPQPIQGQGAKEAQLNLGVSFMIVGLCFVASSVATWFAMVLAWWYRQKVWLDGRLRYARRSSEWPPRPTGTNRIRRIVTSSLIFLVVATTIGSLLTLLVVLGPRANHPAIAFAPLGCMAVTGLVSLAVGKWGVPPLTAHSALDCWTDEVEVFDDSGRYQFEA